MTLDPEELRLAVYTSLASTGRVPEMDGLAALLSASCWRKVAMRTWP